VNKILSNTNNKFLIFLLYLIFLSAFIFNEDSLGGAKKDFGYLFNHTLEFKEDFFYTFFNYDKTGARHSPIFLIVNSFLLRIIEDKFNLRFLLFHLNVITIYYFYRNLRIRFKDTDKKILILLSALLIFSPTFRSSSVWPDSYNAGLMFLIISFYNFHKYKSTLKTKYFFYCTIFYSIASYFSPNFSMFSIFFYLNFCFLNKKKIEIILFFILNWLLAFPAIYYVFVLKIDFFHLGEQIYGYDENFISLRNLSNKIILLPPIIAFHLLPIIIFKKKNNIFVFADLFYLTLYYILIKIFFVENLNYSDVYKLIGGGGILYNLYYYNIINLNSVIIISSISILVIQKVIRDKINYLIILLIILSAPQLSIYHQYFEPLIYLLIFLKFIKVNEFKINYKNISVLFIYLILFLTLNFLKSDIKNYILINII
jgi:hypothetical protein